jgi:hypothetical protein
VAQLPPTAAPGSPSAGAGAGSSGSGSPAAGQGARFVPEPPASYREALKRQQRLMHGVARREHKHVHRVSCAPLLRGSPSLSGRSCRLAASSWQGRP